MTFNQMRNHSQFFFVIFRLQGKAFQWPLASEQQTDSSTSSSIQENEDSVEWKQQPQPQQKRIPRVKFSCDGDTSPSPDDSVSSGE